MSKPGYWTVLGAVLAGLAVVCGAFAAHGLDKVFVEQYAGQTKTVAGMEVPAAYKYIQDFKTGAEYQMYHALALIAVGILGTWKPRRALNVAGWCFLLGIVLFSASLYVLTLTGQTWLGMVAPLGGTLQIVGWCVLAYAASPCTSACGEPLVQLSQTGEASRKDKSPAAVS